MPRSKPVSSVITQFHSLEQAPPSWATPLTWLFPLGNTRSYLFVCKDITVKQHIFSHSLLLVHYWPLHQVLYLVMYSRRSACNGSVSLEGLTLRPQSHTLLRVEVMLVDIWISGWKREDGREKGNVVIVKVVTEEPKAYKSKYLP